MPSLRRTFLLLTAFLAVLAVSMIVLQIRSFAPQNTGPDVASQPQATAAQSVERTSRTQQQKQPQTASLELSNERYEWNKDDKFSIVLLTFKAPKSLEATMQSLYDGGLLHHPQLDQVLVYFQLLDKGHDVKLMRRVCSKFVGTPFHFVATGDDGESDAEVVRDRVRVIGDGNNLPVAQATIKAIRQVRSRFVLYLEGDRPLYFATASPTNERKKMKPNIPQLIVTNGMELLRAGTADIVRMQLYSSRFGIAEKKDTEGAALAATTLPPETYGRDYVTNCLNAHTIDKATCAAAKAKRGKRHGVSGAVSRVFHTAYCKHWQKFNSKATSRQSDLCDSFCFRVWAQVHGGEEGSKYAETTLRQVSAIHFSSRGDRSASLKKMTLSEASKVLPPLGEETVGVVQDASTFYCLPSDECNWTNQPTLYEKSWWLANIATPCEENSKGCFGAPGRGSAVRQEIFFLKNHRYWAEKKFSVCVSRGLFYHNEVDNRE